MAWNAAQRVGHKPTRWLPGANAWPATLLRVVEGAQDEAGEPARALASLGDYIVRRIMLSHGRRAAAAQIWPGAAWEVHLPPFCPARAGDLIEFSDGLRLRIDAVAVDDPQTQARIAVCEEMVAGAVY